MNKKLRFSLLSMLMMLCGSVFADETVIWQENWDSSEAGTKVEDVSNANATYTGDDGGYVKLYTNTSDESNIELLLPKSSRGLSFSADVALNGATSMKLTFTINKNVNLTSATSGANLTKVSNTEYNITVPSGTNTLNLTFATAVDQNGRLDNIKMVVSEGGDDGGGGETEGQTPETAITVDRALELIGELADGAKSTSNYYIKGTVTKAEIGNSGISVYYKNATFNMGDLVVFRAKGLKNNDVTNEDFLKVNDEVVVYGQLQKYVKNEVTTPQVAQGGYIYSINGETEPNPDDQPKEPTIDGGTTPETAITVAAAVEAINTMKDGQTTQNSYYVKGVVLSVTEISTANGNATFVMADEEGATVTLTVFRAKGLENKNITEEEYVQDGDEVIVYGKLQRYVKDNVMTPELSSGYIYELNGQTKEDDSYVYEGDGSRENPYTVEDLKHMAVPEGTSAAEGQEKVWVKGVIAGALNSSGTAFAEETVSNIGLATAAGETEAAKTIPVQLPTGDIRAALNVVDNPDNVGKEVLVYGHILKYMSKTGVKNVSDFVLDGVTGISDVKAENAADGQLYNVAGQRVSGSYKGIVIQNGKKMVVK